VYGEPKKYGQQTNSFPKEDVARQKEPKEEVARGYPTVRWYGESRGLGQEIKDTDTKEPRQDTEEDARTR
jgi:hypothetical protein